MAKSIRAKSNKRYRAELRSTIGQKQLNKNLRKTTRRLLKNLATPTAGQASIDDLKNLFSKSENGIDNGITTEPIVKKKLPYSFNHKYRQQRLDNDLEDETDDEALDQLQKEKEEMMMTTNKNNDDDDDDDDNNNEEEERVEIAGVLKAPEKPLPKRQMTTRHYEWELKDIINPSVPGLYDVVHKPSSSRQRWLSKKNKKRHTKGPIAGIDMQ